MGCESMPGGWFPEWQLHKEGGRWPDRYASDPDELDLLM